MIDQIRIESPLDFDPFEGDFGELAPNFLIFDGDKRKGSHVNSGRTTRSGVEESNALNRITRVIHHPCRQDFIRDGLIRYGLGAIRVE